MNKDILMNIRKSAKTLISAIYLCGSDAEQQKIMDMEEHPLPLALSLLGSFDMKYADDCDVGHNPILFKPILPKGVGNKTQALSPMILSTETFYDILEKHHMLQFLENNGCPSCGQRFCDLKDKITETDMNQWSFGCLECPCQGHIGYTQLPVFDIPSRDKAVLDHMVRFGEDWRTHMKKLGVEKFKAEVEFKVEEDL